MFMNQINSAKTSPELADQLDSGTIDLTVLMALHHIARRTKEGRNDYTPTIYTEEVLAALRRSRCMRQLAALACDPSQPSSAAQLLEGAIRVLWQKFCQNTPVIK